MLDEFTFAARSTSFVARFKRVNILFSSTSHLDALVRFDPRFFMLSKGMEEAGLVPVELQRAWLTPWGLFLQMHSSAEGTMHSLFVSAANPACRQVRMVVHRMASMESPDKPSLSTYFWRMNVLR